MSRRWGATLALAGLVVALPALAYALVAGRLGFLGPRINLDLLLIYLGGAWLARRRPRLAAALIVAALALTLAVQLLLGVGAIYIDDPALIREYFAFARFWPWRLILSWAAVATAGLLALYVALRRIDMARAALWPAAALFALLLAADLSVRTSAGFSLMGSNIATSGAARAFKLGRQWATSPGFTATPIREPMTARLALAAEPAPRRIVTVAVEALGLSRDPAFNRAMFAPMLRILAPRYDVTIGAHAFKGATLSGEMRELCNWRTAGTPTRAAMAKLGASCLPRQLGARGWRTLGIHGNSGFFYNRREVYPAMGFVATRFVENLPNLRRCRTRAFEGACDAATFALALNWVAERPDSYAHLMTLDTHFPLGPDHLGDEGCGRAPGLTNPDLCLYANQMANLLAGFARQLAAAPTPPDLVYVFGDHAPPYAVASDRNAFDRGRVPFITIRRR